MKNRESFDLLVLNGVLIDGSRKTRFRADVGIREGHVAAIGDLSEATGTISIDAHGKIVAPGFIDSHTHDDFSLIHQPEMLYKISQGVTTVVTGNCGVSLAPLRPDTPIPAPLDIVVPDGAPRFESFADYLRALAAAPASVNVIPLVGHTTLRVVAMTSVDRSADVAEIEAMRLMVCEALEAGAFGLSTGTAYPPAAQASTAEIVGVAQPLTEASALYVTHMRNEDSKCMEALEETLEIGRALSVPVVVSHHKHMLQENFGNSPVSLARISRAKASQDVSLDCYPYNASSTTLHLDPRRLASKVVIASSDPHPEFVGQTIADIAALWQVSKMDAAKRLLPATAVYFNQDEGDLRNILAYDDTMVGSDGVPKGERPHPRLWGTFPRVLGHYCREVGLFSLETAVWKMSGLTAGKFGLRDRGTIEVGKKGDLVVFDPDTVIDEADYDCPTRVSTGIEVVVVNGQVTYRDGAHTGARAGRVLRPARQSAAATQTADLPPPTS
jgi:N-acyl-D-amino-acid deacylase